MLLLIGFLLTVFFVSFAKRESPSPRPRLAVLLAITLVASGAYWNLGVY